jgi:hypothetical protein
MPFSSSVLKVPDHLEKFAICFPQELIYIAEGQRFRLICAETNSAGIRRRNAQLKASRTDFQSGISVFHLVLSPEPESDETELNEYDLVKLAKLWEGGEGVDGREPGCRIDNCITFKPPNKEPLSIGELVNSVFGHYGMRCNQVRVGTIQLVIGGGGSEENLNWTSLLHQICEFKEGLPANVSGSVAEQESNIPDKRLLGVAGILQGLLDFDNIDIGELCDVFGRVRVDEKNFIGIHKGTLLQISMDDRPYEVTATSIGISPYLLIPHAILLHNEELLRRTAEAAIKADSGQLRILENTRREMHRSLDKDYLPNIFHYPTERMIYSLGEYSRGLTDLKKAMRAKLSEINAEWEAKTSNRRRVAEDVIAGLLLIISGVSLKDVISLHIVIPSLTIAALLYVLWRIRG